MNFFIHIINYRALFYKVGMCLVGRKGAKNTKKQQLHFAIIRYFIKTKPLLESRGFVRM